MSRRPQLTKTEQLRQARTASLVRDIELREDAASRHQRDAFKVRRRMVRPEPKKVDFSKPGMTKAMLARVKHAQKFKEEYERKQESVTSVRTPKRTPAPIGGDARMGRERTPGRKTQRITPATTPRRGVSPPRREFETVASRLPSPIKTPKTPRLPAKALPRKTTELAKMMNADIIQADPIGEGIISNIVIPPGIVSEDRTTIVNISQPPVDPESKIVSQVANRSIQVISETLDEQDAAESAAVQNRLTELQQARRDFVIAVANVGGNALHLEDESRPTTVLDSTRISPVLQPTPQKRIIRVPELEDLEYTIDHPDVIAAREYMQKFKADMEAREAAKRMEEEFERMAAAEHMSDELDLDIPFEEEIYQERDISWEEDEGGMAMPRPSRIKAQISPIPKQQRPYQYEPFEPEQLEKFFDVQTYPPCPQCGPPPGREHLHPDLWELEDPWYKRPPEPDMPDLIEFEESDLIRF
ncbi:uncharacterized protein LOC100744992 [Bombus impatiens]|uniref:Uncharacterized protein LOC100744992 n=1 Tax=Bombus impatiens TaxID=132113 RepID=A0A6P6F9S1_BOMIM|nr:uncharacterized protein LOC100744992 [Bombus impatiens]